LVGLISLPIGLLILPADFFDYGQTLCPSKRFLDLECPGCGVTRGTQHLLHFDFKQAWEFNKLSFILVPIGAYIWFTWIKSVIKEIKETTN